LSQPAAPRPARIALIGDLNPAFTAHRAIPLALARAAADLDVRIEWTWIPTDTLRDRVADQLAPFEAFWCVPGSPYANTPGALAAIAHARCHQRPFLGTCAGFQHALLEYASSVWQLPGAAHAELEPNAPHPLIAPLACSLIEKTGVVRLVPGSRLASIYDCDEAIEGYHCGYGFNPEYEHRLDSGPLRIGARDVTGRVHAVELTDHPFYIATLFQPERAALANRSHPVVTAFVAAAGARNQVWDATGFP